MEWAEKLQIIERELGIQNDRGHLAKLIGIRPGAIADIKNGKAKNPGSNIALLLINKLGINPRWLEEEELPIFSNRLKNYPRSGMPSLQTGSKNNLSSLHEPQNGDTISNTPAEEKEIVGAEKTEAPLLELARKKIPVIAEGEEPGLLIPVVGQGLSAGLGFDYDDGEVVRFVKIPAWIARKSKDLVALPIYGDSMEPTVSRGDLAVCGSGGFKDDGIYVLRDAERGLMFCKRVVWAPGGWTIMSDNPRYGPLSVDDKTIQIIARVIAAVKEVK
jgi:phage repressor protein C with HTH and peptisase S24 domain